MWQDLLISVASIIFTISLVPQVYYGYKEKSGPIHHQTSVPTFLGLYAITIAYLSLNLYYSTFFAGTTATLWLILFIQRIKYKK